MMAGIFSSALFSKCISSMTLGHGKYAIDFHSSAWMQKASELPVIKIPVRYAQQIEKEERFKRQRKHQTKPTYPQQNNKICLISCKKSKLNHYKGQMYGRFDEVPLTSKTWTSRKSRGDYFTINNYQKNPSLECDKLFSELELDPAVIKVLEELQYVKSTRIQSESIPQVIGKNNTIIAAETGCGKTMCFLAPIFHQLLAGKEDRVPINAPRALVLVPGRELASQIGHVAECMAEKLGFNVRVILGGRTNRLIRRPPVEKVDLVISTFGAMIKLMESGTYNLGYTKHLVLDEADTLLDDTFNEDVVTFLKKMPLQSTTPDEDNVLPLGMQLTLVSATMPKSIADILGEVVPYDSFIVVKSCHLHRVMTHIPQKFLRIKKIQKPPLALALVKENMEKEVSTLIFTNKSSTCSWLSTFLNENNLCCVHINGEMDFEERALHFNDYQIGKVNVMAATDVVSRGLDTTRTAHVLNYDFPRHVSDYIHRCGRIGRINSIGANLVTNFISSPGEIDLVQKIEHSVRKGEALENVNANIKRQLIVKAFRQEQISAKKKK